jgi:manganese/zinc/iron transport system ATP- binding protein
VTPAVQVRHLSARYGERVVLDDASLAVPPGVLLAVVGPNGAGKSTLIKAMLGLIPSTGTVAVHGRPYAENRKAVAYVPQRGSVDWDFPTTVLDVVLMGTYGQLGWFRRPGEPQRQKALAAIDRLGLGELRGRQIGQLSGGQQQRTFLARALAQDAGVLVMDEPFQGVDAVTERAMVDVLRELRAAGRTVICVHHDLGTVAAYFDWAAVMNVRMMSCGPVATAFTPETVRAAYGDRAAGLLPSTT